MSLPMLQVALDNQTMDSAYETTRLIAEEVDIIEVGTILCVGEGVRAVRDLKALYPHKIVLADAKIADAGKILSGATAYVKGQKVTGSMADRGNAQYGTGVGFGSDYVAINNIPEGYYRKNGLVWAPEARIAQSTMAAAIGLNSQNLRQGVTILGVQGDLVPRTPVAYAACSRVLGLLPGTTGDYRRLTKASGYADSAYGSLSGLGYFQDTQSGDRQVVWQCARAGRYLVDLFGDGEVSVRGEVQLSAGQTVTLTIPDAGDIYWRDMKCGGMVILYLP